MKKRYLKPLGLLLALLFVFSAVLPGLSVPAAAAQTESGNVAEIYLCVSGFHTSYIFGHAWICIRNISDAPITVRSETLAPGAMLSVSLHAGVGREFNREMRQYRGKSVTAIGRPLTRAALANAEREIMDSKWGSYLLFSKNCTNFSAAVWKAATGESYRAVIFPFVLKNQFPADQTFSLRIE
ncbi:MAG: hypothetical protein IK104_11100 [Clostridia bacterium]|nr:hypothetical protein [Clostridia bacterium]